jgi:hypothetical protein
MLVSISYGADYLSSYPCMYGQDCDSSNHDVCEKEFYERLRNEKDGSKISVAVYGVIAKSENQKKVLLEYVKETIPLWLEKDPYGTTAAVLTSMARAIYKYGSAEDLESLYPLVDLSWYARLMSARIMTYDTFGRHGDRRTLDFILAKDPDMKKDIFYSNLERAKADIELRIVSLSAEEVRQRLFQKDDAGIQSLLDSGEKSYFGLVEIIRDTNDPFILRRALEIISQLPVEKRHATEVSFARVSEGNADISVPCIEMLVDIASEGKLRNSTVYMGHRDIRVALASIRIVIQYGQEHDISGLQSLLARVVMEYGKDSLESIRVKEAIVSLQKRLDAGKELMESK